MPDYLLGIGEKSRTALVAKRLMKLAVELAYLHALLAHFLDDNYKLISTVLSRVRSWLRFKCRDKSSRAGPELCPL